MGLSKIDPKIDSPVRRVLVFVGVFRVVVVVVVVVVVFNSIR